MMVSTGRGRTMTAMVVGAAVALAGAALMGAGAMAPSRVLYGEREVADLRISLIESETSLGYWQREIETCTRQVEEFARLSDDDVAMKARLAAYPGMLQKALNGRQDAALSVERLRRKIEAVERYNDAVMMVDVKK